jgi:predicted nucleotidyltransferase
MENLPSIPATLKERVEGVKRRILRDYPDTIGLVLIGSVAEGDFKTDSDIDIVWIKRRKITHKRLFAFEQALDEKIQIVLFNRRQLREHFRYSTTMAHSIKNGVILYQDGDYITGLLQKELTLPDREWMKKWFKHWIFFYRMGLRDLRRSKRWHKRFCRRGCTCEVGDYLARAAVNFTILFLELHGLVPTTKNKILKGFRRFGKEDLVSSLEVALEASRQHRPLSKEEAEAIHPTLRWLRDTLRRRLQG